MSANVTLGALDGLAPIGLDELTTVADLQTRKDRKYLVPDSLVDDLVANAGSGYRVLAIDGRRMFRYESVYFDTVDLASYLGAARRRPRRFKVRTRTYLDSRDCMLEVKTRDVRGLTVKHRRAYHADCRADLTEGARRFVATIDQAARVADDLRPTLTTTYRRATLVFGAGDARVTIDADLAWKHSDGNRADLTGLALVETKTSGRPCAFDRTMWGAGHRPVTISKYCTGLAALTPGLPANKWNRVLRRHFDEAPMRSLIMTADHEKRLLAVASGHLVARFGDLVPAETINRVLRDTYDELLAESRVTAYVPVLAERLAAARLSSASHG